MSDRVHRKQRPILPEGYQYGENIRPRRFIKWTPEEIKAVTDSFIAGCQDALVAVSRENLRYDDSWRAPHENAAAQLKRQQRTGEETI